MDYDRLRELQEKFEENPRRYFAPLANEYRKGGQPRRAIDICRAQLTQMPGHISGQIVYGQALYEVGEFNDARVTFEHALTLDPENLIALRSLGDMSLQSGNSSQARVWYSRLLDADPKDTAVIGLVAEIDASAEGPHVAALEDDPAVEAVASAEGTPFSTGEAGTAAEAPPASVVEPVVAAASDTEPAASEPEAPETALTESEVAEVGFAPETADASSASSDAPEGLERHYPVEPASPAPPPPPPPADDIDSEVPLGAEGLHSVTEPTEAIGAEGLHGGAPEILEGAEGLHGSAPEMVEGAEGLHGKAMPDPLAGAAAARSDVEDVVDTWTPPPAVTVPERAKPEKEQPPASGTQAEPFVNETMAQLYLQQGYRQLALRVYHQLAEARPNDQSLKDRIAQIEADDRAAHPEGAAPAPAARKEPPEAPSIDRAPAQAPTPAPPYREQDSVEAPARERPRDVPRERPREAPRAEPEGIAARQPSIKEFFATLGRRRPPRATSSQGVATRPTNSMPADTGPALVGSAPSATLDAVFAGATVNPADSRAASRLAGAFSGVQGTTRATPPTPPMPTPRVNPRLPHTQESEEDVAKFRAWLDGLTGE